MTHLEATDDSRTNVDSISKRFKRAFAPLHASEDTLEQVERRLASQRVGYAETTAQRRRNTADRTRRRLPSRRLGLAVAACALAAGCGAAFATGAIQRIVAQLSPTEETPQAMVEAYSDAISDEKPSMTSAAGTPIALPDMQRQIIDAATADGIIGGYVSAADASVSVGDWTVTLDSFVADENGLAALTLTMENPNGVEGSWANTGYGEIIPGPEAGVAIGFETVDGQGNRHAMNHRFALIEQTDTAVRVAAYLCAWEGRLDGRVVEMTVEPAGHAAHIAEAARSGAATGAVVSIEPETLAPSTALSDDEGNRAVISPLGLYYEKNNEQGYLVMHELSVTFSNGDEYVVESKENGVLNMLFSTAVYPAESGVQQGDSGRYVVVFNRLVDVEQVESVRFAGSVYREEVASTDAAAQADEVGSQEIVRMYAPVDAE